MSGRIGRLVSLLTLLVVGSCGPAEPEPQDPGPLPLPPLDLQPVLPGLREIAESGPTPPTEDRMRALRDMLETAYLPGYAPARSAAMAQRALEAEPDVDWILEAALVDHEDATIRSQCAYMLGERGRIAALPILMLRVKYEPDAVVQAWVIGALSKLGCHGGLDQLVTLMNRQDSAERAGIVAVEVLRAVGRDPGEAPTWEQLQAACTELFADWKDRGGVPSAADDAGATAPVPTFEDLDPLLRARLARHLTVLSGDQLRPVDDCRFVFMRAGVVGVPVLARAMGAAEPYVRNHVLEIALVLGRPAAPLGAGILPMLADDLTGSLAARALGSVGYAPALPYLIERLSSDDVEVRAAAAAGLGLLGDLEAYGPLLERLQDVNEIVDVRVEAAAAVARLDPGRRFLLERLRVGDYHEPTLHELLDAIDTERARARAR